MSKPKRTPITAAQFTALTINGWNIDEVQQEYWTKIPGIERTNDVFGVFGSGSNIPQILNGIFAVAGIDVLVHEPNPQTSKGEGEGNAYHYVFQRINRDDFPYLMYGPYKSETIVPHWFDADNLDRYWLL